MKRDSGITTEGRSSIGETFDVRSPIDGLIVGQAPDYGEGDVARVVGDAVNGFSTFRKVTAAKRSILLGGMVALIKERAEDLAMTICREMGKTIKEARYEIDRTYETFVLAAAVAKNIIGETVPFDAAKGGENKIGFYTRVPAGVVAAITPFNFPLSLAAHKVAPAIAAGNAIVLKPSPKAPLSAVKLEQIGIDAGLPSGVFNVITGQDVNVGKALVSDPRVRIVSFTGSYAVAKEITKIMGFKKFLAECGSNSMVIFADDANIDLAMTRLPVGCFSVAGQVCISIQCILVHELLYESLVSRLVEATKGLRVGNPLDEDTDMGPMVDEPAAKRIERLVEEAVAGGARVLCGGERKRNFYMPTVLAEVSPHNRLWREEAFGPIVVVRPFSSLSEAIDLVNDSPYGLQTGVYTRSLETVMRAFQDLNVGGVMVNEVPTFRVDLMPYGGVKASGIGREGLRFAVEAMTEIKLLGLHTELVR